MIDVLLDTLIDTLKQIPFLFLSYVFIEYLEHKASDRMIEKLYSVGKMGPVAGALLGSVPLCGLAVSAVDLFTHRIISAGTMIALLISCSDEALLVLFSSPSSILSAVMLVIVKIVIAVIAGLVIDRLSPSHLSHELSHESHELMHRDCEDDECEKEGIIRTALEHTLSSFAYILYTLVLFNIVIYALGEESIISFITSKAAAAPLFAALLGLIPNCAPSYILSTLFIEKAIGFAPLVSGLCINAGVGIAALWKENKDKKQSLLYILFMFVTAIAAGMILDVFV